MAKSERDETQTRRRDPAPSHHRRPLVTFALVFAVMVFVIDGIAGERGWLANRRARLEYEQAQRSLVGARQTNAALREEMRRLREDPAAVEDLARRELGLMKPGEKLFIIRDVKKDKK